MITHQSLMAASTSTAASQMHVDTDVTVTASTVVASSSVTPTVQTIYAEMLHRFHIANYEWEFMPPVFRQRIIVVMNRGRRLHHDEIYEQLFDLFHRFYVLREQEFYEGA